MFKPGDVRRFCVTSRFQDVRSVPMIDSAPKPAITSDLPACWLSRMAKGHFYNRCVGYDAATPRCSRDKLRAEASQTVAAYLEYGEESPGSTEQNAG